MLFKLNNLRLLQTIQLSEYVSCTIRLFSKKIKNKKQDQQRSGCAEGACTYGPQIQTSIYRSQLGFIPLSKFEILVNFLIFF